MPSQGQELLYVGRLVDQLRWRGHVHPWEQDPPDMVIVLRSGALLAVEVRELHGHETRRGSPDREFAAWCNRVLSQIRDAYYSNGGAQRLHVSAVFSQRIRSSALRTLTPDEVAADERELIDATVAHLLGLPPLVRGPSTHFQIAPKYSPPTFFSAGHVPDGTDWERLATRWDASPGAGWVTTMAPERLQEVVDNKDRGLRRYRGTFAAKILLLGAGMSGPGTYVQVAPDTRLNQRGFDAVYFVHYYKDACCIAGAYSPGAEDRRS